MKKHSMICFLLCAFLCACSLNGGPKKSGTFLINDASNNVLGEISVTGSDITVSDGTGSLTGVKKRDDKRKYYSSSEVMEYAVKYSEDGFKLRDRNENMIWKVKLYEDKIKIASNEEMQGAYEVKLREGGKLKVERNERELYALHLTEDDNWSSIENKYSTKGFGVSLAPGLLLISELKDREKFIIMAELVALGR
jgi:hypothetical protein